MAEVTWTPQALANVDAITSYIARDLPLYAEYFAARIFRAVGRLALFPRSGRVVPELGRDEIREIIVQGYREIHRAGPGRVEILTVHHGARLLVDFDTQ